MALAGASEGDDVRKEVVQLLEGVRDTYFLKQRKYDIGDPYTRSTEN